MQTIFTIRLSIRPRVKSEYQLAREQLVKSPEELCMSIICSLINSRVLIEWSLIHASTSLEYNDRSFSHIIHWYIDWFVLTKLDVDKSMAD